MPLYYVWFIIVCLYTWAHLAFDTHSTSPVFSLHVETGSPLVDLWIIVALWWVSVAVTCWKHTHNTVTSPYNQPYNHIMKMKHTEVNNSSASAERTLYKQDRYKQGRTWIKYSDTHIRVHLNHPKMNDSREGKKKEKRKETAISKEKTRENYQGIFRL